MMVFNINSISVKGLHFLLNQPPVKATVKKIIGVANLTFAACTIYDLVRSIKKGTFWSEKNLLTRLIVLSTTISIIGLALTTSPGYQMVGAATSLLFSEKTISQRCGLNLNFATTPRHPRHIFNIASFILGIPALIYSIYTTIRPGHDGEKDKNQWIYCFNAFNIITSRVSLHVGNAFVGRIFH